MQTDEELVAKIRQGNLDATDELYRRYKIRLFRFICGYGTTAEDAEEIFHDAFMATLNDKKAVFQPGSFAPYLFQVARRRALNHHRSKTRYDKTIGAPETKESLIVNHHSERQAVEQDVKESALAAAIDNLEPAMQELFRMRSLGLSYSDMAETLQVPLGTVKSRIHNLIKILKKEINQWTVT